MKSALRRYSAAIPMIAALIATSLMDNWWIDWNTHSRTMRAENKEAIILDCLIDALVLYFSKSRTDTNSAANNHINGNMSSGKGKAFGSVSINQSGPHRYKLMSATIFTLLCRSILSYIIVSIRSVRRKMKHTSPLSHKQYAKLYRPARLGITTFLLHEASISK